MDVKQEPFDSDAVLEESVIFDPQIREQQFLDEVVIKEENIKCEVPKIEQLADLPAKIDYDMVNEKVHIHSTIKKEPENTNDFYEVGTTNLVDDKGDFKREVSDYVQVKTESEFLTSHCDLPTLKNEDIDYIDYLAQPGSSKQAERPLLPLKNKTLKGIHKKRRMYPCPVCQKNFHSSKSRTKHIDRHFGKRCVVCKFCGKFLNRIEFLRHYFIHVVQNRNLNVPQAINEDSKLEKICMNYIEQKIHTKNYIKDKSSSCDLDSKELKKNHNFISSYSKSQAGEKSFKCDICCKEFTKNYLKIHSLFHSDEKRFKCHLCAKKFNQKSVLQQHLLIHTNDRSFKCPICCKPFKLSFNLRRHLITHTKKYPFECNVCSKGFKSKPGLQEHLISHTNEKQFKCDICSKLFNVKSTLTAHLKKHTNEKPFKCDICFKNFYLKSLLQDHLLVHTIDKLFKCAICSKQFKYKSSLHSHLTIHSKKSFKCDICSKKFNKNSNLIQHLVIHDSKKAFKCDICSKEFSLKCSLRRHFLTIHSNEKPFKCDICSKKFNRKYNLQIHLKLHTNESR